MSLLLLFRGSRTAPPDEPRPSRPRSRRFAVGGIAFNIDEDDEELLMMLTAAAPLLNRRH